MQVVNGMAGIGVPRCSLPRAVVALPAAATLARTTSPGGAVAAEQAGAGTVPHPHGPGAGACLLSSGGAI
jgi:hypothetical protein